MKHEVYLLPDDRLYAEKRIVQLEKEIQDLGPDFNDAFSQSSETWHDNSPFEAVRDKQSMLAAELHQLRTLIRTASLQPPKIKRGTVGIGHTVWLANDKAYTIAGDWTPNAGHTVNGATVVSRHTPVANALIGKKKGESVQFGAIASVIDRIDG
jgi:transcription elongation GreA/GreB family factor